VTDHRIGLSVKNIQMVMEGDGLHEILDALKKEGERAELEEMMEAEPTQ
jgi:peptide chain release factor 1